MSNYIYGETEAEAGAVKAFFAEANWPIPVSQGLALAAEDGGARAWLCLRHTELGLMRTEEYTSHLCSPPHPRVCISCGGFYLTPDEIMRWTIENSFPVRVTWDTGKTTDGIFPGGSDVLWHSLAQRCVRCLDAGAAIAVDMQTARLREEFAELLAEDE
jgi:hypothetical protein